MWFFDLLSKNATLVEDRNISPFSEGGKGWAALSEGK
jgi:hypothetical protein